MKRVFSITAVLATLFSLWLPSAALAAGKARVSQVDWAARGDQVSVTVRVTAATDYEVDYLDKGVQLTFRPAVIEPAKRHIPVDRDGIREVFAYQYDPETVRVRLLTDGISGRDLETGTRVETLARGVRLVVTGLPSPEAAPAPEVLPEPLPKQAEALPVVENRTVPEPVTAAPKPELAEPAPAVVAQAAAPVDREAARTRALSRLEEMLASNATRDSDALGGGFPAQAAAEAVPPVTGEITPEVVSEPAMDPAPVAQAVAVAEAPVSEPVAAETATEAPAAPVVTAKDLLESGNALPPAPEPSASRRPLTLLPQASGTGPDLWSSGARMAGGLLLVLALLLGGMALLRRFRAAGFSGRVPIRVLGSAAIGSRQNIVVVEVDGRRLVVGVSPNGMAALANLEDLPASAEGPPGPGSSGGPGGNVETPATPFAKALKNAGDDGAQDVISRAARNLERHLKLLRARSA